jgi:predicted RNA-binding protein with PIN domain
VAQTRRRRAVALPPAILDDSTEAAAHLVRTPGILLVVDGYNVTLSSWPGLDLADQRQRLVDALAELTTRAGTTAHLIFDGVAGGNRLQPPPVARRRLRVEFSPSEVEADELIISLVGGLDPAHPVVVATDDRRVRREVSDRGANVISVEQLRAVLGRSGARHSY